MIKIILDDNALNAVSGGSTASISITVTQSAGADPVVNMDSTFTGNGAGSVTANPTGSSTVEPGTSGTRTRSFSSSTRTVRSSGSSTLLADAQDRRAAFLARVAARRASRA